MTSHPPTPATNEPVDSLDQFAKEMRGYLLLNTAQTKFLAHRLRGYLAISNLEAQLALIGELKSSKHSQWTQDVLYDCHQKLTAQLEALREEK